MVKVELRNGKDFQADPGTSILESARRHGIALEHSCRSGRCGVCKVPVTAGTTKILRSEESLTADEAAAGLILTCCRSALSNVALDIEDLGRLGNIPTKILPCRISTIDRLASTVMRITLRLPPNADFTYLPGQYIDVMTGGTRRSYSLANAPRPDGTLELHVRHVENGLMSEYWFSRAKVNDLLRFEAPLGTFFLRDTSHDHLIFLATGTGIAPVKSMLEEIALTPSLGAGKRISVYWGNRASEDFYWQPETEAIQFSCVLSRNHGDWSGRRGHVQVAVLEDKIDLTRCVVYACGSEVMIHAAERALVDQGLERKHFYFDAFVSSN